MTRLCFAYKFCTIYYAKVQSRVSSLPQIVSLSSAGLVLEASLNHARSMVSNTITSGGNLVDTLYVVAVSLTVALGEWTSKVTNLVIRGSAKT